MTPIDHEDARLTSAGAAALEEFLERERRRILDEALSLSRGEVLGASDIVNAYESLAESDRQPTLAGSFAFRETRRSSTIRTTGMLVVILILFTTMAAAVVLALWPQSGEATSFPTTLPLIVASFGAVAAVGATITFWHEAKQAAERRRAAEFTRKRVNDARLDDAFVPINIGDLELSSTEFIIRWAEFESSLRRMTVRTLGMAEKDAERYPIGEMLRGLSRSGIVTARFYDDTRRALAVRNALIHGGSAPKSDVEASIIKLDRLQTEAHHILREHPTEKRGLLY
jgi:hypothetical protein